MSYVKGKDNVRDAGKTTEALKTEQLQSIVGEFRAKQGYAAPIIIVGDSESDLKAAMKLGLFFVGFGADEKKRSRLQKAGVQIVITDFGALPDIVEQRILRPPANDLAVRTMKPDNNPRPKL
jgi:phosphoglycolate phosphatase-like HAD superfamily hydrolase